jgi:hypothetical protein
MAIYIDSDGNYPRYDGDILQIQPLWEAGDPIPEGWSQVVEITPPTPNETTYVYEGSPIEVDGILSQNWISRPYTQEELLVVSSEPDLLASYRGLGLPEEILEEIAKTLF